MTRRHGLLGITLLLILLASACRDQDNTVPDVERQDRIIATAATTDDPSALRITWFPAPCETFDTVEVNLDQDYANLLVKVTVDVANCPDPGSAETIVQLGEPLGERSVWDRTVSNTVALDVE